MNYDINKLTEQFSLQVIGCSDPEQALIAIYQFLKNHFPMNLLNVLIHDTQRGIFHYRIAVTDERVMLVDEKVKLSAEGRNTALHTLNMAVQNIPNTKQNSTTSDVAHYFSVKENGSSLSLTKRIDGSHFLLIGLFAWGVGLYNETHVQLMNGLFHSLTSVMQNIQWQLEVHSEKKRLITENRYLRKRIGYRIVGEETGLQEVMDQIKHVAPLDIPVLLIGETGVGKEVLANAIHQRSKRAAQQLVSINCAAIPGTLLESELFGSEKTESTGESETKQGYFEQADGGSLYMDEISELSLMTQIKLLRCLQTMEVHHVGAKRFVSVDVRVIGATNRDLEAMVEKGQFRKDLWYRFNVFPIRIPPLRERKSDIPDMALYYARIKSNEMNLPFDFSFAPESMEQLQNYHWPGNIRELQNVIERKLIISQGKPLSFYELTDTAATLPPKKTSSSMPDFPILDKVITQHIRKALLLSKGRVEGPGGAAELLGTNPSTLRARMRKYGIKMNRSPA